MQAICTHTLLNVRGSGSRQRIAQDAQMALKCHAPEEHIHRDDGLGPGKGCRPENTTLRPRTRLVLRRRQLHPTWVASVTGIAGGEAMEARGKENALHILSGNLEFCAADLTKPLAGKP